MDNHSIRIVPTYETEVQTLLKGHGTRHIKPDGTICISYMNIWFVNKSETPRFLAALISLWSVAQYESEPLHWLMVVGVRDLL